MESVLGRYRTLIILVAVLFLQVLGLAVQVKRAGENEPTRLIRIWTVAAVSPIEKGLVRFQNSLGNIWHNYLYLRGVRAENRQLKSDLERLRLEQVRISQDAQQAQRLQSLLGFKEQVISQTMPAQVIGTTGSEQSRAVYIDKGSRDGIKPDMAVINADGILGKVLRVFHSTSLVLLINDQSSGVGAILQNSRLQGVLRGSASGELMLEKVMSDEQVKPGEAVLTSGGDGIFPKGMTVGTVFKVSPGNDLFLKIKVKPNANLSRFEEVLVITRKEERQPDVADAGPIRAIDILAQRLPSVPVKPAADAANPQTANAPSSSPAAASSQPASGKPPAKPGIAGHGETTTGNSALNKPATTAPPQARTSPPTAGTTATPPGATRRGPAEAPLNSSGRPGETARPATVSGENQTGKPVSTPSRLPDSAAPQARRQPTAPVSVPAVPTDAPQ